MRIAAICLGYVLDALLGDPHGLWHPICAIGSLIARTERLLRGVFPKTSRGERAAGACMWVIVCTLSFVVPFGLLWLAGRVHPLLAFVLETLMCYQIFARRSLHDESSKVYDCLAQDDLVGARTAVGYIVGRDTGALSAEGVTKATVETVAENASDGVVAPMLYLFLGGAPLGFLYKAVNTMDSMVGYKNDKYLHFGCVPAKLDDVFNWIPARLTALCMILTAPAIGLDGASAYRIWKRDRRKHASPNAAQTEAACAGALGIQLAGNAFYFGKLYEKPTLGDPLRAIEAEDIDRTNRLMTAAATFALLLFSLIALALLLIF